jgi:magnesium transporter
MVAAISGNAGLQTSAIVISGLATGHLAAQRISQVFIREVRIALLVALSCGIIGGLLCAFLPGLLADHTNPQINSVNHLRIVMAFAVGMFLSITVSTTLGLVLPFVFKKIGIDPAIASGPLVTTANDSISVAIYMTLTFVLAG